MTPRVLVLSGGVQPFVDPWHPFAAVSERVAAVARDAGLSVELSTDPVRRLADLTDVDVLVVNAPNPAMQGSADAVEGEPPSAAELAAAEAGLDALLQRRVGVLGVHVGATALLGFAAWPTVLGARWVPGVTWHPPLGPTVLRGAADPRVPGPRIEVVDERYTDLELAGDITTLVDHEQDGRTHALVWAREVGPVRVVGDALGHDPRSFDSAQHRELLARCLRWLARA